MKVFHLTGDRLNGCVYYRNYLPSVVLHASTLAECRLGHKIHTKTVLSKKDPQKVLGVAYDASMVEWADIVVFSRYYPVEFAQQIRDYVDMVKDYKKKIIYEVDDDFFNIPIHNAVKKSSDEVLNDILYLMENADAFTVTTDRLGKLLQSKVNKPYYVLPNSVNLVDFDEIEPSKTDKIRIGWSGGATHQYDLKLILPAMKEIMGKYSDVEFVFFGDKFLFDGAGFPFEHHPFVHVLDYPRKLKSLGLDIGLCPLEDNDFNRNKSVIKWIEYSACKTATIYSNVPPYSDSIKNGITGLAVQNDVNSWENAIIKLIEHKEMRDKLSSNAYNEVKENYDIIHNFKKWYDVYNLVLQGAK